MNVAHILYRITAGLLIHLNRMHLDKQTLRSSNGITDEMEFENASAFAIDTYIYQGRVVRFNLFQVRQDEVRWLFTSAQLENILMRKRALCSSVNVPYT